MVVLFFQTIMCYLDVEFIDFYFKICYNIAAMEKGIREYGYLEENT